MPAARPPTRTLQPRRHHQHRQRGRAGDDRDRSRAGEDVLVPLRDRLAAVSAQFGWDQAGLAVTDPEVLSRLTHRVMSASTMASMNGCPSRWAFEKMWPGDPDPFTPALIGNGAHTVLERLYERPPVSRTMDTAMIIARNVSVEQFPGEDPLSLAVRDRWLAELYAAFKGIFDIEDPTRVVVEGRELKVETTIAGVGFVGFIDRLERNGDGGPRGGGLQKFSGAAQGHHQVRRRAR